MSTVHTRRAHHSGRRIMRANIGGRIVLLSAQVPDVEPSRCPDPDCRAESTVHDPECALDMSADAMHRPRLPGAREGVW